ncbi:hypothetical protein MTO96_045523 [Rhipicephalus appendiculatus]
MVLLPPLAPPAANAVPEVLAAGAISMAQPAALSALPAATSATVAPPAVTSAPATQPAGTPAPVAPPAADQVTHVISSLLLTLRAVGETLPMEHPLEPSAYRQWPSSLPRPTMASLPPGTSRWRRPSVLQWNVNWLERRRDDLAQHLLCRDYDVLAMQGGYARAAELRLPGYVAYSSRTGCTLATCQAAP